MTIRAAGILAATALGLALAAPATAQTAQASAPVPADWGWGIQTANIDSAVKPGDDFNHFVNGKWLATVEIPADRTETGGFIALRDLSEVRMKSIMDELVANPQPAGSAGARVAAVYSAFMNTDAIEAAGLTPAYPMLTRIYGARTLDDLTDLFMAPGLASPVNLHVHADGKNSAVNALYASQASLGLPDRDYYLVDNERNRTITGKYKDYLTFLAKELGYADPVATAEAVYGLEKRMAAQNWDRALGRNRDLTYNKLTVAEFAALAPDVPLAAALGRAGLGAAGEIIVGQLPPTSDELAAAKYTPEMAAKLGGGVPALARMIATEPMATWQAWLAVRFIASKAAVLPKRIDDANFAFYGTTLGGQPEQRPRWKRAIGAVEGAVGELAGQVYAERFFPAANKAAMDRLVGNLRTAMAANLADLKWMGPETRVAAKAKLDAFTTKIGYPGKYKTYDGLIVGSDAFANALAADKWRSDDNYVRIGKPVDRDEWLMFPQTVNAYYLSTANEIAFPAAILQPPFFNISADDAVNYGAIGGVIGHEIGHGFDDQGAKSDGQGNLRDWWTPADKANFEKLTGALVDQYNAFCPFDDGETCVNGRLTLGENIGDLGGLSLAYRAYKLSLNGKEAPVIDGYTGDQRFFMGWAQAFKSKSREAAARQQLQTDPHSPDEYRVNGVVRNFDEWYRAFNIQPGDKLYLPPEKRLRIW
ncbi:putative endopeptidase [Novosphingobium kunmingense]|uniref:Putative endopeptidase n=1 Tax=Novosphingobium kunmingense TaxID=1211806 RepID=A0A2N0H7H9_9SPHN|nr:M13 family metallopeptidase [Novosphingobium kunmingense]PKB14891.1 putative endopeptidase [Novosphingobium kunmingense]